MPGNSVAEIYFIAGMFVLILILSGVSMYFFFRTYKKEMKEKREREEKKALEQASASEK